MLAFSPQDVVERVAYGGLIRRTPHTISEPSALLKELADPLRLRVVDPLRLNPESVMPSYYRTEGLNRVAPALRGKPVLTEQQVEDTIAYLLTLR